MTINDAVRDRIAWLRKPIWNPSARMKIDLMPDGGRGPWAHLYDKPTQEVIGEPTPQTFLLLNDYDDDWEKCDPPEGVS